jgi:hypothetical protein
MTAFRKFADQLAINQAATFAEMVNGFGFARAQTRSRTSGLFW